MKKKWILIVLFFVACISYSIYYFKYRTIIISLPNKIEWRLLPDGTSLLSDAEKKGCIIGPGYIRLWAKYPIISGAIQPLPGSPYTPFSYNMLTKELITDGRAHRTRFEVAYRRVMRSGESFIETDEISINKIIKGDLNYDPTVISLLTEKMTALETPPNNTKH